MRTFSVWICCWTTIFHSACGGKSTPVDSSKEIEFRCEPGAQMSCYCFGEAGFEAGISTCAENGKGWEVCNCSNPSIRDGSTVVDNSHNTDTRRLDSRQEMQDAGLDAKVEMPDAQMHDRVGGEDNSAAPDASSRSDGYGGQDVKETDAGTADVVAYWENCFELGSASTMNGESEPWRKTARRPDTLGYVKTEQFYLFDMMNFAQLTEYEWDNEHMRGVATMEDAQIASYSNVTTMDYEGVGEKRRVVRVHVEWAGGQESETVYEYNEAEIPKLTKVSGDRDCNGIFDAVITYSYESGLLVMTETDDSSTEYTSGEWTPMDGLVDSRRTYSYDENGRKIQTEVDFGEEQCVGGFCSLLEPDGIPDTKEIWEYDDGDSRAERTKFDWDADGNYDVTSYYVYDEKGNIVQIRAIYTSNSQNNYTMTYQYQCP